MKKFLLAISLSFIIAGTLLATPSSLPSIAVLPFRVGGNVTITNLGPMKITREVVENEFTNQLIQFLVNSRKFNVVNREDIKRIMEENRLTESDWAKPGQEASVGKLLVADFLVTGNINRIDFKIIKQDIAITGETRPRIVATFKTQYKVTEVKSGKVVAAGQTKEVLRSADVRREVPVETRRDWGLADFKDMLFNKASTQVGDNILAGIYPVKIAAVEGMQVTLNRGEGAGIAKDQVYTVYNPGQKIVDPDTKEVLGSTEVEIAQLTVTAVNPKFSTAIITKQNGPVQIGAICRLVRTADKDEAPDYPKVTPGW